MFLLSHEASYLPLTTVGAATLLLNYNIDANAQHKPTMLQL